MIDTVLFDMGGTLENVHIDGGSRLRATGNAMQILAKNGFGSDKTPEAVLAILDEGWERYNEYRDKTQRELKPEEIWGNYLLPPLGVTFEQALPFAEEMAHSWEISNTIRSLRPGTLQMLEGLKNLGMKLGIISNTVSLYQVFQNLEDYGIRDYFQDVTLSSVTGYRKPNENIFKISLRQMRSQPENCAYVGDTVSRDVIGPRNMGFGLTFRIDSFLTRSKDRGIPGSVRADYMISDILEVYTILRSLSRNGWKTK